MTARTPESKQLIAAYKKIKPAITKRLNEFGPVHKAADDHIFGELCFCLMTANANALKCDEALKDLRESGCHINGSIRHVRSKIKGRVRFHNRKASYIVGARNLFKSGSRINMKARINHKDVVATRDWLVDNVKGIGYKEASHFLRNIGLGQDIAILDRHILKNLARHGVIQKIPDSVGSRKIYIDIENKMRVFSKSIGIPLEHLDLLFWSIQTGFIFK